MIKATATDRLVVAMAREVREGQFWAQGLATPMTAAALALAQRLHAPRLWVGYTIGNVVSDGPIPVSIAAAEGAAWRGARQAFDFLGATRELLPRQNPHEFLRPAQVDATGATNNVCLGPHGKPTLRLPGGGGISDVTPYSRTVRLYVPRHTPRVLVGRLDFKSGVGHLDEVTRRELGVTGPGPLCLFTDLAVLHWPEGRIQVRSLHEGVTIQQLKDATGFDLDVPSDVPRTPEPTELELRTLREEVDPQGLRDLEALGTGQRLARLRQLLRQE